jgi:Na+/H+ antiporter NhaC
MLARAMVIVILVMILAWVIGGLLRDMRRR